MEYPTPGVRASSDTEVSHKKHRVVNRVFTNVFANSESVLFYAPIRVFEIQPKCGPSKGGTRLKITGTGFTMTNKMRVRFTFGKKSAEVDCSYGSDGSVLCITPTFSEGAE
jgi:hypothetical protein